MAERERIPRISFDGELGRVNPVYTYADVWGDGGDLKVTITGVVVNDSAAPDQPVIAANASYDGPVTITFNRAVSGFFLQAGAFDAVDSTRVRVLGPNGFKIESDRNRNDDGTYRPFSANYGENVIKSIEIIPVSNEPAGFAVDNIVVYYRPETVSVKKSNDAIIDSLLWWDRWADTTIKYSFASAASTLPGYGTGPETFNGSQNKVATLKGLSAGQKAMARASFELWDDYVPLTFQQVPDDPSQNAQLRFLRADIGGGAATFLPGDGAHRGDVTFDITDPTREAQPGDYLFTASMLHEIGHALGLSHPHNSHGNGQALAAAQDSIEFSVMSYRSYAGAPTDSGYTVARGHYPTTPMLNDIKALQYFYGANWDHNSGDTIYRFDPTKDVIFYTIWDGGGNDWYDGARYTDGVTLRLRPGAWSILDDSQLAILDRKGAGAADDIHARGNVANAYQYGTSRKSLIENANGGRGNDTLSGNQAGNILDGRKGADIIDGLGGNDYLLGGRGNDRIYGGSGNDWLIGEKGKDRLNGHGGNDVFVFRDAGDSIDRDGARDVIAGFIQGEDRIKLKGIDANTGVAGDQAFAFIGAAGFTAAGQVQAVESGGRTYIRGDVDGDGTADFGIEIAHTVTLTAGDFIL